MLILKKSLLCLAMTSLVASSVSFAKNVDYKASVETIGDVTVTFVGRQSQKAIVDLYSRIDVLFAPSKWPESYGLVTREAAACGCWVVASSMGGIGEDIVNGKSGFVILPELEEIKDVITKISSSPATYKKPAICDSLSYSDEQVDTLFNKVYAGI